jgi:hypothetical protein
VYVLSLEDYIRDAHGINCTGSLTQRTQHHSSTSLTRFRLCTAG